MQIKIGIVGTQEVVHKFKKVIKQFPTFAPIIEIVNDEYETPLVVEQLSEEVEVLLLFGAQSHSKVKEHVQAAIPVHYVPLTGAGLYRSLFYALSQGKLYGGISVDTLTRSMVMRTLKELEMEEMPVVVYNGPAHATPEQLLDFHRKQVASGICSIVFTGVRSVFHDLLGLGIACECLTPSEEDMIVALERALLSTESRRSKESQIVVGMINIDHFGKMVMKRENEHEVQKLKLDIHRMVLGYVQSLDGYLTTVSGDEFLFFTTRGIFERETGGYKTIPLAKEANASYGTSFSIGVGFGISANEAGTNARVALRKSKEAGGNTCFIVREDRTLIGPLEMVDPVQTMLSPISASLVKRAEDAGMTSTYLSKILTHMSRFGKYEYKVHELANLLEVTVRSTHRLLLLWMDNGLVEIAGMEKVPKGRPRQIYRFSFLEHERY